MTSAAAHPAPPTRNPYRIEADEGPQTIGELKAALGAVDPAELAAFTARLDAVRTTDTAALEAVRALVTEYRHVWVLRTHPDIQRAIEASTDPHARTYSADDVLDGGHA
ncbi:MULTISPECIES: hypothetical protein [unclassified Streptomyces]|uniref:hypothetical protein n=1 Tax=unclassified Streptomyces TaxID=2593676 RepID=UPI00236727B1|nr:MULTISPECIES: hypothetical protein [unclassified Streptomyces]MDF3141072.1 hypothetical protein [Streptomyces sp. T21Q-yed]WDF45057.1 hypothetical protein PBV52_51065 [Streptomyces sp. T12]